VSDRELIFLQEKYPPGTLTGQVFTRKQPLKGLVVSQESEGTAMQVQVEGLNRPNHSKEFPLIWTVDTFMGI
jgi:hypothetical protein